MTDFGLEQGPEEVVPGLESLHAAALEVIQAAATPPRIPLGWRSLHITVLMMPEELFVAVRELTEATS